LRGVLTWLPVLTWLVVGRLLWLMAYCMQHLGAGVALATCRRCGVLSCCVLLCCSLVGVTLECLLWKHLLAARRRAEATWWCEASWTILDMRQQRAAGCCG
jgi:hypothetical protein